MGYFSPARAFDGAILFLPVKLQDEQVFEAQRFTDVDNMDFTSYKVFVLMLRLNFPFVGFISIYILYL